MIDNEVHVHIRPKEIVRILATIVALLVSAHIAVMFARYVLGHGNLFGVYSLFNLDSEQNIPTYFSSLLLLFASLLLFTIARFENKSHGSYSLQWTLLAFGFFYLSIDEAAGVHELLGKPTRAMVNEDVIEIFGFAWVIPGIVLALGVVAFFFRFFLSLPRRTRLLVFAAGSAYLGGAIGIEIVGGRYEALHGGGLTYKMIAGLEEALEMVGILIFIYAMLTYLQTSVREVRFHFGDEQSKSHS